MSEDGIAARNWSNLKDSEIVNEMREMDGTEMKEKRGNEIGSR